MRFLPASDAALLVELDDLAHTLALHRALETAPLPGVTEMIPAARTLLVHYQPEVIGQQVLIDALGRRATSALGDPDQAPRGRRIQIPVHYTGEDLEEVAELLGMSTKEVIARHTGHDYQAAFAGFAPGFVYLSGNPFGREIPRRQTPRVRVPAGSVAVAGSFSAVYPGESPGGWQLLGRTEIAMWDLAREEPAFIRPGFSIRFVDAADRRIITSLPTTVRVEEPRDDDLPLPAIEFVSAGLQTLVQDGGRTGMTQLGVSPSGALDRDAMHEANRMVGNPIAAPVLENLLGRLRLRCHGRATLAIAGAPATITLEARDGKRNSVPQRHPVGMNDGDLLELGPVHRGTRCYLAVRGGWQVEPVLGSCATDTLGGIGPSAIVTGSWIGVGRAVLQRELGPLQEEAMPSRGLPKSGETVTLDIVLGPRTDWFAADAVDVLTQQPWQVTPASNRVGMRLHGEQALVRSRFGELQSEGTVTGAIQVPANGQPLLFLADHPITGGYPVIGAVARYHLDLAGQISPRCFVRFNVVAPFFSKP